MRAALERRKGAARVVQVGVRKHELQDHALLVAVVDDGVHEGVVKEEDAPALPGALAEAMLAVT